MKKCINGQQTANRYAKRFMFSHDLFKNKKNIQTPSECAAAVGDAVGVPDDAERINAGGTAARSNEYMLYENCETQGTL
jgi:hypothetical protein